jgi:hypothetical protein
MNPDLILFLAGVGVGACAVGLALVAAFEFGRRS